MNTSKRIFLLVIIVILLGYIFQNQLIWKKVYPIQHRDLVWENSDKYDIDPYLVLAIMKVESRFEAEAVSKRGAKGLMQLMPDTAFWIAEQNNLVVTEEELFLPQVNIPLATWYLGQLINQFDDEVKAIAAYNAGRGNVSKWLQEGTWDGTIADAESIPFGETRDYVLRVSIAWKKYLEIYSS